MKNIIYSIAICVLAIISVVFAFIDLSGGLSDWMRIADAIIYIIFVLDYVIRFFYSEDKKTFFKGNILDLISIIPVNSAFRFFRTLKIFKLAKLTKLGKLARFFAITGRLFNKAKRFFNTNGFKYILLLSASLIVIGGLLISHFENMGVLDGIWWAFVTATTVGYGDISPETGIGKIIACVLMINGIGLIGSLTSTITAFFIYDNASSISNDKIRMVLTLYNELNDSEKEVFKSNI